MRNENIEQEQNAQKNTISKRNILLRLFDKKLLGILVSCMVSGIFWLGMSLNEMMEKDVEVPIYLTNVPKDVVITSDIANQITVTIYDKGFNLLPYIYGNKIKPVAISYSTFAKSGEKAYISNIDLQRALYKIINGSTKITNVKPEKIEFFYNHGRHKSVPVIINGTIMAHNGYEIKRITITPSNVDVYAAKDVLEAIKNASTEKINLQNITDTTTKVVNLYKTDGVKCVPEKVKIQIYADLLTEKIIEVPINPVNVPENKILRLFPAQVKVKFTIGTSSLNKLQSEAFRVEADYNSLSGDNEDKCELKLVAFPKDVKNARLETEQVDYLVEQQ